MRLPDLFNQSGIPPRPEEQMPFFDPKKYEQLVATAVLNKVIWGQYFTPITRLIKSIFNIFRSYDASTF